MNPVLAQTLKATVLMSRLIDPFTMSGLVAYGSSDEEDTMDEVNEGRQASEVRHCHCTLTLCNITDWIDLRRRIKLRTLDRQDRHLHVRNSSSYISPCKLTS